MSVILLFSGQQLLFVMDPPDVDDGVQTLSFYDAFSPMECPQLEMAHTAQIRLVGTTLQSMMNAKLSQQRF